MTEGPRQREKVERSSPAAAFGLAARREGHWVAWFVLGCSLLLTALATLAVSRYQEALDQERFRRETSEVIRAIEERMEAYTATLIGVRGSLVVAPEISLHDFRELVASLELRKRYPGIQGIGFAAWVPTSELAVYERRMRSTYWPDFRVWPSSEHAYRAPIQFLEPLDWRNQRAIGYDMGSEAVRREAIERAARTGQLATTGKVVLVQEAGDDKQPGFLTYLPVYGQTSDGRRVLHGFIYSPFRAHDLFQGIFQGRPASLLELKVFDGQGTATSDLLYVSNGQIHGVGPARFSVAATVAFGGRTWTLAMTSTPGFEELVRTQFVPLVALAGILVSGLLFGLTWLQGQARHAAEHLAADLKQAEQARAKALAREHEARLAAERARHQANLLAEAGTAMASSLIIDETLPRVAQLTVPTVADWCIIHVFKMDGSVRLVAAAHRNHALAARLQEVAQGRSLDLERLLGAASVIRSGQTYEVSVIPDGMLRSIAGSDEQLSFWRSLGWRHALSVPLNARGQLLGVLTFVQAESGRGFEREEREFINALARRVTLALDNAWLYREAQSAIEVRDEFLSIASHELRTPLTSLQLVMQSLLKAPPDAQTPEALTQRLERAVRQVRRLGKLVNELLDISRITSGRLRLEREPVDFTSVVRDVVGRLDDELQRSGSVMQTQLTEAVVGCWDRLRLEQVVTNLVSNAIKYGEGRPIDVAVERNGDMACLTVRDRGIGIAPEHIERIFAKFERAVSARHYGGLGLGLFIVRQILEAMEGDIRVQSAPDQGSTFIVRLPLEDCGAEQTS